MRGILKRMNRVELIGRLTKDPEIEWSAKGAAICAFTLAVPKSYRKDDEPTADFINVIVFNKSAENCANYLKKGSQAGGTGRIETRKFTGNDNKPRFYTRIVADSVEFLSYVKNSGNEKADMQDTGEDSPFE